MRNLVWKMLGAMISMAGSALAAEQATAIISLTGTNGSNYDYSIVVHNTGTTTIGTFWYGWVPGEDFLNSAPASASSPTGWSNEIAHFGSADGYSIEWTAAGPSSYIPSGGSLMFDFSSPDDFATMTGTSSHHLGTPVGTSYIYSAEPFSDNGYSFVVAAPEPAAGSLLFIAAALVFNRRRPSRLPERLNTI